MTPWDHFEASYFKMLNDTNVAYQLMPMPGHVEESETARKLKVCVTILSKVTSFI